MSADTTPPAVRGTEAAAAANALTARWIRATAGEDPPAVVSGAGVWPLLAALAAGAGGPVRRELAAAAGVSPETAFAAVRGYVEALGSSPVTWFASGIWTAADLRLDPSWAAALPDGSGGRLTGDPEADRRALDAWANDRTLGLIDRMPLAPSPDVRLLLATALAVRTPWSRPFTETPLTPRGGPWAGTGPWLGLRRDDADRDAVLVLNGRSGMVTTVTVEGAEDVDVVIALGRADAVPAEVLATAVESLGGGVPSLPGGSFRAGDLAPGLTVGEEHAWDTTPILRLTVAGFRLTDEHDLLGHAEVFGLGGATGRGHHFPGVAAEPLEVGAAVQSATAAFGAMGFEAAAVTAVSMLARATMPPVDRVRTVLTVDADRPFAYVAVHRPTRLALVGGWVAEPLRFDAGR